MANRLVVAGLRLARRAPVLRASHKLRIVEALDDHRSVFDEWQGKRPAEVRLELHSMTVAAICFTEEFAKLAAGLRSLRLSYPSKGLFERPRFDDIVNPESDRRVLSAPLFLPFHGEDHQGVLAGASVAVSRLSPSIACIALTGYPSATFKRRLDDTLTRPFDRVEELRITRRGRFALHLSTQIWFPYLLRLHAVDDLLVEVNRALTRILRSHTAIEWANANTLPAMTVFGWWPPENYDKKPDREFWDVVSTYEHYADYEDGGLVLCAPRMPEEQRPFGRRVLLNVPRLLADVDLTAYASETDAVGLQLTEALGSLPAIVALEDMTVRMRNDTAVMRRRLAPQLAKASRTRWWQPSRLRRLRPFRDMQELNRLLFEKSRVEAELDWDAPDAMMFWRLAKFKRRKLSAEDKGSLRADVTFTQKRQWSRISKEVALLQEAFRNSLDYGLQSKLFWLTIVGLLLTAVGVVLAIPADQRKSFWDWINGAGS